MDALCLVSAPRTGTGHLGELLRNFPELASLGRVFSPAGPEGVPPEFWPALRQVSGITPGGNGSTQLLELARDRPGTWLEAIESATREHGRRLVSFRLWPGDLAPEVIGSEVVPRPGMRVIAVVRRQIDTYVSWRKATALGKWRDADTTGVRPVLDIEDFEDWLAQQERWYHHWRDLIARRYLPLPILRYEIDIDIPIERALKRIASAAALVGVTLRPPVAITHSGLQRQDTSRAIADKIDNWGPFSRELSARGLERRAFGYPI